MWEIDLHLDMESFVFWSLIPFWKAPWQGSLCFLAITTIGKGPFCYDYHSTVNIDIRVINIVLIYTIARYTRLGSFDAIIHWSTTNLFLLLCFMLNYHIISFCSQILNMYICDILSTSFCCRQINPQPSNFRSSKI